jgi:hypothetical protein
MSCGVLVRPQRGEFVELFARDAAYHVVLLNVNE